MAVPDLAFPDGVKWCNGKLSWREGSQSFPSEVRSSNHDLDYAHPSVFMKEKGGIITLPATQS
jgi:hypothetical protein